jgi:hypothetical protein
MISGLSALTPVATIRASGRQAELGARVLLITTTAAAPSFSAQQLPAVTVPSGRKTGARPGDAGHGDPGAGPVVGADHGPVGQGDGDDLGVEEPVAIACSARFWERTPNSSCSRREMPRRPATFSAVWPIAM